jgi:hypothetical protein
MTTIRITAECALPPTRVLHAAFDFGRGAPTVIAGLVKDGAV